MKTAITDAELEIMKILWREARPVLFTDLRLELEDTKSWNSSTVQTLLYRLRGKGYIHSVDSRKNRYVPDMSREEYLRAEGQSFLDRMFDGSAKKLVAAFCESGQLTEHDVAELRDYFNGERENG
jgi:BlaI family penicillinase repressor